MRKILNPVVLIHKRENNDTYAVAITNNSDNYRDAILMASMEPDMVGDDIDTWSKTGYYMAEEIENLREKLDSTEEKNRHLQCLVDDYDWQRQRLHSAALKVIGWCRTEAAVRTGNADNAENYACVRELRDALLFCEKSGFTHAADSVQSGDEVAMSRVKGVTTGKPLTITLPDISSKVFWSGAGKNETFHPETYKRWVKEAIERACVISGTEVRVK